MDSVIVAILVILSLMAGAFIFSQYTKDQEKKVDVPVVAPVYSSWYPYWRGSYVPPSRHYRTIRRRPFHRR
jgi:hypothetical protein